MKAIVNGKIIQKEGIFDNRIIIMDEKIVDVIDESEFFTYLSPEIEEIIDAKGLYVSPGFIDLHIHGSGGYDTMDGTVEALEKISSEIIKHGTTSFLPTTMTMPMPMIQESLNSIRAFMSIPSGGARALGAHLEGPFINVDAKGAQNEAYIVSPDINLLRDDLDIIKLITIAPETEGAEAFIKAVRESYDTVLSIGHTKATYEQALDAIDWGVSHCTHLFNAMTPLHHRNPGVVGAAFTRGITCELIADTIHVHPALFKPLTKIIDGERLILITDSMRAGCMQNGEFDLGGQKVSVKDQKATLENGKLAGSVLTLDLAVKNFWKATGMPLNEIIALVSENPAKRLGLFSEKGSIECGKDADIILFDETICIQKSFIKGVCLYDRDL